MPVFFSNLDYRRYVEILARMAHLLSAVRYVLLNPVRAGLSKSPDEWPYSSARAHLGRESDPLVNTRALARRIEDWGSFLSCSDSDAEVDSLRHHSCTGRPLGSSLFVARLEMQLARCLRPRKKGRPRRAASK